MKVLHVVPNPFYLSRGGLLRAAEQITIAINQGIECRVVCYHLGEPFGEVPIHRIVRIPWYRKTAPGATFHRIYLDALLALKCFAVAKKFRPDLIHAHLHEGVFAALPYARKYRTPLLLDAEGSLSGELRAYGFPGMQMFCEIERRLNNAADRVITSSQSLLDALLPTLRSRQGKPSVVYDSIDTVSFAPREPDLNLKVKLGIKSGSPVAVYLGSLDHLQGIDLLMDLAKRTQIRIPGMQFLIMGGPGESSWRRCFIDAGVRNCIFTGAIARKDAPRFLSIGSAAVSLKKSGSLQSNSKLLDYMAMGLPVVAFETPANWEILGDNGCWAPEGDIDRAVGALESVIASPSLRQKLGESLRARAIARFSREARAAELAVLYREMTAGYRARDGRLAA